MFSMVWEFPAVSQTRIDFWKKPQFTQSGMWWFTLLFGLFGLHHFLLRSPQTALILFLGNLILLGYPWLYDLLQLSSEGRGGLSTDELNKYGLSHPWGALGLAQGMWIPPKPSSAPENPPENPPANAAAAPANAVAAPTNAVAAPTNAVAAPANPPANPPDDEILLSLDRILLIDKPMPAASDEYVEISVKVSNNPPLESLLL